MTGGDWGRTGRAGSLVEACSCPGPDVFMATVHSRHKGQEWTQEMCSRTPKSKPEPGSGLHCFQFADFLFEQAGNAVLGEINLSGAHTEGPRHFPDGLPQQ